MSKLLEQPLTTPLSAISGTNKVTAKLLLNLPEHHADFTHPTVKWLTDTKLIYALLPTTNNQMPKIEMIDVETKKHQILIEGYVPKPSPNGQWIVFVRSIENKTQIWLIESAGTKEKLLITLPGNANENFNTYNYDFSWAPDSTHLAFFYQESAQSIEQAKSEFKSSKICILNIINNQFQEIATIDAAVRDVSWFNHGKELLFMTERIGDFYGEEQDITCIQTINIQNGNLRTLAEFNGLQQFLEPIASPNDEQIAFMYDADHPIFNFMRSIGLVSTASPSTITRMTKELQLRSPQWSHDSQSIYALRYYGAYKQLYLFDIKKGEASQITDSPLNIENYVLSPNGNKLAWIGRDAHNRQILRVAERNGRNAGDLVDMPAVPNDTSLSEVREIEWDTMDYPHRLRGLLFLPLNYQKEKRYPLIIDIHGGGAGFSFASLPMGAILTSTPLEWQLWTAKGYAVFVPEFRSSANFGSLAISRDELQEHDLVNCDIKDTETGIDALVTQGLVDSDRLVVIGHSAGGRRANWLTVATHRFQAVVSKEGWADEFIPLSKRPNNRTRAAFGGLPFVVPQNYLKNSALYHSAGATTPTLFLMGNPKLGGIDEFNTVGMLYGAIKAQGVETEYISYQDEGHVFEKRTNRKDALERTIQWIDKHIGNNL